MSDLVEFVRQRIAEERAAAEAANPPGSVWGASALRAQWCMREADAEHIGRQDPAATLARCDFFDWLIEQHPHDNEGDCDPCWPFLCPLDRAAAIWSTHPDYRQEWVRDES